MVCIYCGHDTNVTNSRSKARLPSVWRRRACEACVAQFTTLEQPDYATAISVSRSGSTKLEPFSRDKLFLSLNSALGHRKDSLTSSTALTQTILSRVMSKKHIQNGTLSTNSIAKESYQVLKRFDPLAANTYKAYHTSALK